MVSGQNPTARRAPTLNLENLRQSPIYRGDRIEPIYWSIPDERGNEQGYSWLPDGGQATAAADDSLAVLQPGNLPAKLVSNASDAIDNLRFQAISKPELLEGQGEPRIRISADKDAGTVTIEDNGIGMSRDEVVANLGTIARSGTAELLRGMTGEQKKDSQLIGQFGVGFYSSFILADRVEVFTRRAGSPAGESAHWSSNGDSEFDIATLDKPEAGTRIVLHLKEDAREFADDWRLRGIVKRYADHIGSAIEMPKKDDGDDKGEVQWEYVNDASALWTRPRNEVTDEEYRSFYQHIAHDFEEPLSWSHNRIEGNLEYTSLL